MLPELEPELPLEPEADPLPVVSLLGPVLEPLLPEPIPREGSLPLDEPVPLDVPVSEVVEPEVLEPQLPVEPDVDDRSAPVELPDVPELVELGVVVVLFLCFLLFFLVLVWVPVSLDVVVSVEDPLIPVCEPLPVPVAVPVPAVPDVSEPVPLLEPEVVEPEPEVVSELVLLPDPMLPDEEESVLLPDPVVPDDEPDDPEPIPVEPVVPDWPLVLDPLVPVSLLVDDEPLVPLSLEPLGLVAVLPLPALPPPPPCAYAVPVASAAAAMMPMSFFIRVAPRCEFRAARGQRTPAREGEIRPAKRWVQEPARASPQIQAHRVGSRRWAGQASRWTPRPRLRREADVATVQACHATTSRTPCRSGRTTILASR